MEKITVKQASEQLGLPIGAVRGGIEQGSLPIGFAVKGKRTAYYISPEKFKEFLRGWRGKE